jgi:nitrite reductase/ring-hydroxylating ferredoxin subunit
VKAEHDVAAAAALAPGEHGVFEVAGRQFGIFNVGGSYYALPNACFHQNGPLCRGKVSGTLQADAASGFRTEWRLDGEVIICPWHSLEFHVRTGQSLAYPDRRLPTHAVRVRDGRILLTV